MEWEDKYLVEMKCQDVENNSRTIMADSRVLLYEFVCTTLEIYYGTCKVIVDKIEVRQTDDRTCGDVARYVLFVISVSRGTVIDDGKLGMKDLLPQHAIQALREKSLDSLSMLDIHLSIGQKTAIRYKSGGVQLLDSTFTQQDASEYIDKLAFNDNGIAVHDTRTYHRVTAIYHPGKPLPIGFTIRFSRFIKNLADPLYEYIVQRKKILIVGPPGAGKTTLLRDIIRIVSKRLSVGVIDYMGELTGREAPSWCAPTTRRFLITDRKQFPSTLKSAVRYHSPTYLIADDVEDAADVEAVRSAAYRGVPMVVTAQSKDIRSLLSNPDTTHLLCERQVSPFCNYDPKGPRSEHSWPQQSNALRKVSHFINTFDVVVEMCTPTTWYLTTRPSRVIEEIVQGADYRQHMEEL